jgi:hypothetical protein
MLQAIYLSTARPELPPSAIDEILAVSRRNNHADGISGMLLYDGYHFLQALEGDAVRVRHAFDRIKDDPRHRAVVLLSCREIVGHAFGEKSMAAHRVPIGVGGTVADLVESLTEEVDPTLQAIFRGVARVRVAA